MKGIDDVYVHVAIGDHTIFQILGAIQKFISLKDKQKQKIKSEDAKLE